MRYLIIISCFVFFEFSGLAQKSDSISKGFLGCKRPTSDKVFMVLVGTGAGPQLVNKYDELSNIRLGNKYQIGAEVEFSPDLIRKERPSKFSMILNYGMYYTYEKISFQTYYDASMSKDFSHTIIINRVIPTLGIKFKLNSVKYKPYFLLGVYAKKLFLRKDVIVTKGDQLYFSNGNFDPTPSKVIITETLLYAIPGAAVLISSMPYCEIGLTFPRYPNVVISTGAILFDNMIIEGPNQNNYIHFNNYPQNYEKIFLGRTSILFKLKMRLR